MSSRLSFRDCSESITSQFDIFNHSVKKYYTALIDSKSSVKKACSIFYFSGEQFGDSKHQFCIYLIPQILQFYTKSSSLLPLGIISKKQGWEAEGSYLGT